MHDKRTYDKDYYEKNKERLLRQKKQYREKRKEYYKEYFREYRKTHKDLLKERNKKYYEENKQNRIKYREKNREKIREYNRKYYKKNKRKLRAMERHRNKILKEAFVDLLGGKCERCGYNKCLAALDFHHINPLNNKTRLGIENPKQKNFDISKVILLCANCHREEHWTKDRKV